MTVDFIYYMLGKFLFFFFKVDWYDNRMSKIFIIVGVCEWKSYLLNKMTLMIFKSGMKNLMLCIGR